MPKNSCVKGKVGERELAQVLRDHGFTGARRGQQHAGGADSPDVVCPDIPGVHFECKRVEAGNPYKWLEQAARDGGLEKIPVVAHRKNKKGWIAILPLDDFLTLLKRNLNGHPAD